MAKLHVIRKALKFLLDPANKGKWKSLPQALTQLEAHLGEDGFDEMREMSLADVLAYLTVADVLTCCLVIDAAEDAIPQD